MQRKISHVKKFNLLKLYDEDVKERQGGIVYVQNL